MPNERILIVEDEELVAKLIRMSLVKYGYDVLPYASTRDQTLKAVQDHKPDLVLMDISLPGKVDGIDVAKEVRFGSNVPVIFLSGISDGATIQRSKAAEPLGYLFKPFDPKNLQTTIDTSLHQFKAAQRREQEVLRQAEQRYSNLFAKLANEIEIPLQGVTDNLRFLQDAFDHLTNVLECYRRLTRTTKMQSELMGEIEKAICAADLPCLIEQTPKTIAQTFEQLQSLAMLARSIN